MTTAQLKCLTAFMAAMVITGCQSPGKPAGEREGYFSWVDEQGRVQYTRIPDTEALPASSQTEGARHSAEREKPALDAVQ